MAENKTPRCFANLHMTMAEHSLWSVCRSLSYQNGSILRFDGRYIAKLFADGSKSKIYRTAAALVEAGWLIPVQERRKDPKTGRWLSTYFYIQAPEEWAEEHPHDCKPPLMEDDGQSPIA
jgi:hypothetical protein